MKIRKKTIINKKKTQTLKKPDHSELLSGETHRNTTATKISGVRPRFK